MKKDVSTDNIDHDMKSQSWYCNNCDSINNNKEIYNNKVLTKKTKNC